VSIYLGTMAFFWSGLLLSATAARKRMKNEGYEEIKIKKSMAEEMIDLARILFYSAIPLVNIAIPLYVILTFDKCYEELVETYIEQGKIIKKDYNEAQQEEVEIDIESNDKENSKKYSDLTNEEKLRVLEREKSILLSEKEDSKNNIVSSYNDKGSYKKTK